MLVRAQLVLFSFLRHGALNVKLSTLEYFTLYLRNRQSGNLRTIENCICGLRSIERNMRSFLRTVRARQESELRRAIRFWIRFGAP